MIDQTRLLLCFCVQAGKFGLSFNYYMADEAFRDADLAIFATRRQCTRQWQSTRELQLSGLLRSASSAPDKYCGGYEVRNLLLAFDGTWQSPDKDLTDGNENTNVWRLANALLPETASGVKQLCWYFTGLGTQPYDRLRGGILGQGLDEKIAQGYATLVKHHRRGDRLFLSGFSRGAYTARSLAGMIERVGLVRDPRLQREAYELYRDGTAAEQRLFRMRHSRQISIEAIAVWDTVGALGIPLGIFDSLNIYRYQFHDTRLGKNVRHAYQALAIDEHRERFAPTLWTPKKATTQQIEQRWFIGAHSDVGGGCDPCPLSARSLAWIQAKLAALGLASKPISAQYSLILKPTDSWRKFLSGFYSLASPRHFRPIGFTQYGGETLASSVSQQLLYTEYSPQNPIGEHLPEYQPELRLLSDYKDLSGQYEDWILG